MPKLFDHRFSDRLARGVRKSYHQAMNPLALSPKLCRYIEEKILPEYASYEPAHGLEHIRTVIANSLRIAEPLDVDANMVYAIAAYHDIGIRYGREDHHLTSAKWLEEDMALREFFDERQIRVIKEAIEDHRASSGSAPRSIYGCIIAEADRDLNPRRIIERSVSFALSNNPGLSEEETLKIVVDHLQEKYAEGGYLRLFLNDPGNVEGLATLREWIRNGKALEYASEDFRRLSH